MSCTKLNKYNHHTQKDNNIHGKRFVCIKHFGDYGIKNFIHENITQTNCSYCDSPNSTSLDLVIQLISDGIYIDYDDLYGGNANWDQDLDDFDIPYFTIEEILQDEIGFNIEPNQLLDDIEQYFSNAFFCKRDSYSKSEHEQLMYDWDFFSYIVKYKIRYLFYTPIERYISSEYEYKEQVLPNKIFNDIGDAIHDLKLYTRETEPLFTIFRAYRARQHRAQEIIKHFSQIGPAPKDFASANRFSPSGITMFYAADDETTAIEEVIDGSKLDEYITIGTFETINPLNLIDLTRLPYISCFDHKLNKYVNASRFLRHFIAAVTKPIIETASENIDYVPSQIVTEYFKHVMPKKYSVEIHGIKFKSTKRKDSNCYVLFIDESEITQNDETFDNSKALCLSLDTLKSHPVSNFSK